MRGCQGHQTSAERTNQAPASSITPGVSGRSTRSRSSSGASWPHPAATAGELPTCASNRMSCTCTACHRTPCAGCPAVCTYSLHGPFHGRSAAHAGEALCNGDWCLPLTGCIATRCGSVLKRALSVWCACVCVCVVWPVNNDCARVPWPEPMIFTFTHAYASRYIRSHAHHLTNRSSRAARPVRTRSRPRHSWVGSEDGWLQCSVESGRVGQSTRFAPGAPH